MHFPIISFEDVNTPREEWTAELPYDDPTLNEYTDYAGEPYSKEDRSRVIHSLWLKDLFEGYAVIDEDNETITFNDKDTIVRTFQQYLIDETERLHELAKDGMLSGYAFRNATVCYKDHDTMFYDGSCVFTSFQFMEDAIYLAGKILKIGNVFDAHI